MKYLWTEDTGAGLHLSPWNENIKNVRKVTYSKYSRSKNCSLEKSQTAVFINILFYLALTFFFL